MIGEIFGRLVVIGPATKTDRHLKWECLCSCGNKTIVRASNLRTQKTLSCGCWNRDSKITHGAKKTRLYQTWINMRRRCTDKNAKDYKNYGGRGIGYTPVWNDFSVFQTWALSTGYNDSLTIERKDCEGNYEPNNCCWADWFTQASTKRKMDGKSSIYLGVTAKAFSWEASVKRKGINYYVGKYGTEIEAAYARDDFIIDHFWPHKLNFPERQK